METSELRIECQGQQGTDIEVCIKENPTTGYRWRIAQLPPDVVLSGDRFEAPEQGVPGAGGLRLLTFQARASGAFTVSLELKRPWETSPLKQAQVLLHV